MTIAADHHHVPLAVGLQLLDGFLALHADLLCLFLHTLGLGNAGLVAPFLKHRDEEQNHGNHAPANHHIETTVPTVVLGSPAHHGCRALAGRMAFTG